jgi:hypothetical protein
MNRLSLRNNWLKFKPSRKLRIILGKKTYTIYLILRKKTGRSQHIVGWTWKHGRSQEVGGGGSTLPDINRKSMPKRPPIKILKLIIHWIFPYYEVSPPPWVKILAPPLSRNARILTNDAQKSTWTLFAYEYLSPTLCILAPYLYCIDCMYACMYVCVTSFFLIGYE